MLHLILLQMSRTPYASFGIMTVCESPPFVTVGMVGAHVTFPYGVAQAVSPISQSDDGIVAYFESTALFYF